MSIKQLHSKPSLINERKFRSILNSAERLRKEGQLEQAFIIGWTGMEGVLRALIKFQDSTLTGLPPQDLLKNLLSQGLINQREFLSLTSAMKLRNEAVHGFLLPQLKKAEVKKYLDRFDKIVSAAKKRSTED